MAKVTVSRSRSLRLLAAVIIALFCSSAKSASSEIEQAKALVVLVESQFVSHSQSGGGIIFGSARGRVYIATPFHLVRDRMSTASSVKVQLAEQSQWLTANVLQTYDQNIDLAVLTVSQKEVGDLINQQILNRLASTSALNVNDRVHLVGHPAGQHWKISAGRILASDYSGILVETSGIYPGSSGSALLNEKGKIIGMVSQARDSKTAIAVRLSVVLEQAIEWGYPIKTIEKHIAGECRCRLTDLRATDNAFAYMVRGDRCEGLFVSEVSGSLLVKLVSFTTSSTPFVDTSPEELQIQWVNPFSNSVTLQGNGLSQDIYYRMDTECPAEIKSYVWNTDFLNKLSIDRVGIYGFTNLLKGNSEIRVFLPVTVTPKGTVSSQDEYIMLFMAPVVIADFAFRVTPVSETGIVAKPSEWQKPRDGLRHYAGSPIRINVKKPDSAGVYLFEIATKPARSNNWSRTEFFIANIR